MSPRSPSTEALLEHADFVRRLATYLVHDASLADDVAQEVWLRALRNPPRSSHRIRGWFAQVTRNVVRQWRRNEARRSRREREAAPRESLPASDEIAHRTALMKKLAELVGQLPEPYRTTVWLRFYEGLTAQEIADREGVAASTIRSRLSRAVARIRVELDRSSGGRSGWLAVLTPFTIPTKLQAATAGGLVLGGGFLMKAKASFAACVVIALAGAVYWIASDSGASRGADNAQTVPPRLPALAERATETAENSQGLAVETPVEVPPEAEASTDEPPTKRIISRIVGRCVDSLGAPIEGAVIGWDPQHADARPASLEPVKTGANGRFEWRIEAERDEAGREIFLLARAPLKESVSSNCWATAGETVWLRDLVLHMGGVAEGRVVDPAGEAIPTAKVITRTGLPEKDSETGSLWGPGPLSGFLADEAATEVDAQGRFRLTGLRAGEQEIWAGAEGYRYGSIGVRVPEGGEAPGAVLVLSPLRDHDTVTGIVLDPQRRGVAGAEVRPTVLQDAGGATTLIRADEEGRFVIRVGRRGIARLEVRAPAWRWPTIFAGEPVAPGSHLELQFEEPRQVRIEATGPDGAPLSDVGRVTCEQLNPIGLFSRVSEWSFTDRPEADPPMLAVPDGLIRFRVQAGYFHCGREQSTEPMDGETCPEVVRVSFEEECLIVRGVVQTPTGEAVSDARVLATGFDEEARIILVDGFPSRSRTQGLAHLTRTRADGSFELSFHKGGDYLLLVEAGGFARLEHGPIPAMAGRTMPPLSLTLNAGGGLTGKVTNRDGSDPAGLVVAATNGDGHPLSTRVRPDGTYLFENLAEGIWRIDFHDRDIIPSYVPRPLSRSIFQRRPPNPSSEAKLSASPQVVIEEGRTSSLDLVFTPPEPVVLEGHVAMPLPGAAWQVRLREGTPWTKVDPRGDFVLEVGAAGRWGLELRSEGSGESWFLEETIVLETPNTTWSLQPEVGRIEGQVLSEQVRVGRVFLTHGGFQERRFQISAPLDVTGRFSAIVPAGELQLQSGEHRRTVQVQAGEVTQVEIR